jgi:hypothetical protein
MSVVIDGTLGITTPAVTDTGTLSVTGVTTLTGGLNAALPVLSGGTGVTTSTGSGANVLGTSPTLATPTFDSAQLATISGTAPLYMCRAWVNFNGTGTVAIRASGNVSSITDNGTGDYTVNFTTVMPDVNYSACGQGSLVGTDGRFQFEAYAARTTTAYRFLVTNYLFNGTDSTYVSMSFFR